MSDDSDDFDARIKNLVNHPEFDPMPSWVDDVMIDTVTHPELDVELADIINRTTSEPELAGVRTTAVPVAFTIAPEGGGFTVECTLDTARVLRGTILPMQPGSVTVRLSPTDSLTASFDEFGMFEIEDLPETPVQIQVTIDRQVATRWVVL